jgi:hypothetical protein
MRMPSLTVMAWAVHQANNSAFLLSLPARPLGDAFNVTILADEKLFSYSGGRLDRQGILYTL